MLTLLTYQFVASMGHRDFYGATIVNIHVLGSHGITIVIVIMGVSSWIEFVPSQLREVIKKMIFLVVFYY